MREILAWYLACMALAAAIFDGNLRDAFLAASLALATFPSSWEQR